MNDQAKLALPRGFLNPTNSPRLSMADRRTADDTSKKIISSSVKMGRQSGELGRMMTQLLKHGIRLLNADSGGALLGFSPHSASLSVIEQSGLTATTLGILEQLARRVCDRGEAVILDDHLILDETLTRLSDTTLTAVLIVPIGWESRIFGALAFASSHSGRAFSSADFEVALMLGSQAGMTLHNYEVLESSRREIDGLGRLQTVAKELLASADIRHMMYVIARETVKYAQAQDVHIYLYDADTDGLTLGTSLWGPTGEMNRVFEPPRLNGLTRTVARSGQRIIASDPAHHPLFRNLPPRSHALLKYKTILGLPLKQDDKVIGVLDAFFDKDLSEETLRFLDELEDQAALAFQKEQIYRHRDDEASSADLLLNVAQALTTAANLEEVLRSTMKQCAEALPCEGSVIYYFGDDATQKLLVDGAADCKGIEPSLILSDLVEHNMLKDLILDPQPVILSGMAGDGGPVLRLLGFEHIQTWLYIPMLSDQGVCGLLLVGHSQPGVYRPEHKTIGEQLAALSMLAVDNTLLYEELEHQNRNLETLVEERTGQIVRDREILRAIVENAGEGIIFFRPSGIVEFANQAWQRLTGLRARDIMGKPLSTVLPQARAYLEDMIIHLEANNAWGGEIHAQRVDGSEYDAAVTFAAIRDSNGDVTRLVGTFRDSTAQNEVDRMRRQFVANVSHELRTPITSLKLYHSLLTLTSSSGATAEYLNTMIVELNRLEKLIQDLLDISNVDRGEMPFAPGILDLGELVRDALRTHQARAETQGLHLFEIPFALQPLPIRADRERILQMFANLLINAINHTPSGGNIRVSTTVTESGGEKWAALVIADTGTGIPPEDMPYIFDRFFRSATSKTKAIPGTGLGLSIVREIVDVHKGKIDVQSKPNCGTRFTVLLPLVSDQ